MEHWSRGQWCHNGGWCHNASSSSHLLISIIFQVAFSSVHLESLVSPSPLSLDWTLYQVLRWSIKRGEPLTLTVALLDSWCSSLGYLTKVRENWFASRRVNGGRQSAWMQKGEHISTEDVTSLKNSRMKRSNSNSEARKASSIQKKKLWGLKTLGQSRFLILWDASLEAKKKDRCQQFKKGVRSQTWKVRAWEGTQLFRTTGSSSAVSVGQEKCNCHAVRFMWFSDHMDGGRKSAGRQGQRRRLEMDTENTTPMHSVYFYSESLGWLSTEVNKCAY